MITFFRQSKNIFPITIIFIFLFLIILSGCHVFNHVHSNASISASELQRFQLAIKLTKLHSLKPAPDNILIDNAIEGMLEGLDKYSTYLDKNDLQILHTVTTGEFSGIGLEVQPQDSILRVIAPMDNSPAQKAGILPNDEIIKINGHPVAEMTYQEAMQELHGKAGTSLQLTLVRRHVLTPITLRLTRIKLHIDNVKSQLLQKDYAYIRITSFQKDTPNKLQDTLNILQKKNGNMLHGLVLDLRNNPGGLLDSAAAVAQLFLSDKYLQDNRNIVSTKSRQEKKVYLVPTNNSDILNGAPIVILINEGSASGAEVVAGALHDHQRALLVGMKTFGKGSVQTVIPLNKEGALKMTTALYYTPSGTLIDHIGINPDVEIKPQAKGDIQLERGFQLLKNLRQHESV